jgi:hypothetical protein
MCLRLPPRAVRESGPHACILDSSTSCGIARLALSPVAGFAPGGYAAGNLPFECLIRLPLGMTIELVATVKVRVAGRGA